MEPLDVADPEQVGPYRIVARLGTGGMGSVYLGTSPGGRLVAVKVIHDTLGDSAEFRTRFRREIAAARRVSGLFAAPVVDADLDARSPWLATVYVPGPSLTDAVTRHGPLPPGSVLALMAGLAEGLAAIHAAGVVHRDLKPANVLLTEDGPRVIDFGISQAAETGSPTQPGVVIGSPGFMSPEQAEGAGAGPASDVFSLGSVLAYAANGEGPFGVGSAAAQVHRVVNPPPNLFGVPAEIRPLLTRCLAKDPAARPTPAGLLAELGERGGTHRLEGWLPAEIMADYRARVAAVIRSAPAAVAVPEVAEPAGTPFPHSPPPSPSGQRPGGPVRRHRRALLQLAAVAAVVLTGTAWALTIGNEPAAGHRLGATGTSGASAPTPPGGPTTAPPASDPDARATVTATPVTSPQRAATPGTQKTPAPGTHETPAPGNRKTSTPAPAPAIPAGVQAVQNGKYEIDVTWASSAPTVTGYTVSNGCPPGGCGGGALTVTTAGNVLAASFAVTPGTYECFRVQAFNSNGTSGWSSASCAFTSGLVVPGTSKWTSTGVEVQSGDELGLTASGIVNIGTPYPAFKAGPGGDLACIPTKKYPHRVYPVPAATCWSLIARIGTTGMPFYVGPSDLVATGTGELFVGINDDVLTGNSGAWTVNIKIGALPPPP